MTEESVKTAENFLKVKLENNLKVWKEQLTNPKLIIEGNEIYLDFEIEEIETADDKWNFIFHETKSQLKYTKLQK